MADQMNPQAQRRTAAIANPSAAGRTTAMMRQPGTWMAPTDAYDARRNVRIGNRGGVMAPPSPISQAGRSGGLAEFYQRQNRASLENSARTSIDPTSKLSYAPTDREIGAQIDMLGKMGTRGGFSGMEQASAMQNYYNAMRSGNPEAVQAAQDRISEMRGAIAKEAQGTQGTQTATPKEPAPMTGVEKGAGRTASLLSGASDFGSMGQGIKQTTANPGAQPNPVAGSPITPTPTTPPAPAAPQTPSPAPPASTTATAQPPQPSPQPAQPQTPNPLPQGKAEGGETTTIHPYIVNEEGEEAWQPEGGKPQLMKGPEQMVVFPKDGKVIPHKRTMQLIKEGKIADPEHRADGGRTKGLWASTKRIAGKTGIGAASGAATGAGVGALVGGVPTAGMGAGPGALAGGGFGGFWGGVAGLGKGIYDELYPEPEFTPNPIYEGVTPIRALQEQLTKAKAAAPVYGPRMATPYAAPSGEARPKMTPEEVENFGVAPQDENFYGTEYMKPDIEASTPQGKGHFETPRTPYAGKTMGPLAPEVEPRPTYQGDMSVNKLLGSLKPQDVMARAKEAEKPFPLRVDPETAKAARVAAWRKDFEKPVEKTAVSQNPYASLTPKAQLLMAMQDYNKYGITSRSDKGDITFKNGGGIFVNDKGEKIAYGPGVINKQPKTQFRPDAVRDEKGDLTRLNTSEKKEAPKLTQQQLLDQYNRTHKESPELAEKKKLIDSETQVLLDRLKPDSEKIAQHRANVASTKSGKELEDIIGIPHAPQEKLASGKDLENAIGLPHIGDAGTMTGTPMAQTAKPGLANTLRQRGSMPIGNPNATPNSPVEGSDKFSEMMMKSADPTAFIADQKPRPGNYLEKELGIPHVGDAGTMTGIPMANAAGSGLGDALKQRGSMPYPEPHPAMSEIAKIEPPSVQRLPEQVAPARRNGGYVQKTGRTRSLMKA